MPLITETRQNLKKNYCGQLIIFCLHWKEWITSLREWHKFRMELIRSQYGVY